jgi:hypothetical protein
MVAAALFAVLMVLLLPPLDRAYIATSDQVVRMIATNTRLPREVRGDLMAMWGAARLGAKRIEALLSQHGAAKLEAAVEAILDLGSDPCALWVTGPSKTADVEGILIEGVHGPGIQVCLRLA